MSGAEIIVEFLEQAGVRIVAGIPGGALLPLYDALGRSQSIRHVLARHEQAAGFIAQGMARVTGRAGVCLATSGPGATNIVTALADAKLDSIPLVCITGQVPSHLIGTDAFQEVATVDMARPITKAAFAVQSAHDLRPILNRAFQIAEGGRPGPVLIDVPKDVQSQQVLRTPCPPFRARHASAPADFADYRRAHQMIARARKPLLYFGGGIIRANAHHIARRFAERTGIPMVTSLMGLGILPREHALNLGMLGMHGARSTNAAIAECDLLLAVGTRFDDRATGNPHSFAANAQIIHIDIDARELGKIKRPTLAIVDDAASALNALLSLAIGDPVTKASRAHWRATVDGLKAAQPLLTPGIAKVCSPYGIMRALGHRLHRNTILTTDVGQHQMWAAQSLPIARADGWLTSGGLGTMGFGLPAAIGAALADETAPVVCITGDGSLLMNVQELATLAELALNVKIILLDNASLGMVRQQQDLFYARRRVASGFGCATDFVAVARAFGVRAVDLALGDADATLARELDASGPCLIRVPIDAREQVLPMVPSGACNTHAIDHAQPASMPQT